MVEACAYSYNQCRLVLVALANYAKNTTLSACESNAVKAADCRPCSTIREQSLRPDVTSSIKPEVHNVAQRRRRRTEPRPQGICIQNFVKIGPAVPEICSRTDRQTSRHTDRRVHRNTAPPTGTE